VGDTIAVAVGSLSALLVLASPVLCLAADEGPCRLPEPARLLPGAGAAAPVVAANFGLLFPPAAAGVGWQYVCDDLYRTAPPERVWRAGARLFAGGEGASRRGLLISQDDGCSWRAATGDVAGQAIADLAFADDAPAIWALGVTPVAVYLSGGDGDARFGLLRAFPGAAAPARLVVAPSSRGRRLYLGAREAAGGAAVVWASDDGGASWGPPRPRAGRLVAVAPADPEVVFFQVSDPLGDELWRSGDGGVTAARVLKLPDFELFAGLAFGASGGGAGAADTLYVAGRAPIVVEDLPPGRLYVSRDGGATWLPPVRSGPRGPSYRCLERREGRLWACGAGEGAGEDFLLGVSSDEGQSWAPVLRLADVRGARACARAACVATENWLCEGYGSCAAADAGTETGADAAAVDARSGGADDARAPTSAGDGGEGARRGAGGGCDCALGGGDAASRAGAAAPPLLGAAAPWLLGATLVLFRGRRRKIAAADTHHKPGGPGRRRPLAGSRARLFRPPS
jgi:hypothetical protein